MFQLFERIIYISTHNWIAGICFLAAFTCGPLLISAEICNRLKKPPEITNTFTSLIIVAIVSTGVFYLSASAFNELVPASKVHKTETIQIFENKNDIKLSLTYEIKHLRKNNEIKTINLDENLTYQDLKDFYESTGKTVTLLAEKDGKTIKKEVKISREDLGENNQLATLDKIYKYDEIITKVYVDGETEHRIQHLKFQFKEDDKNKELEAFLK